MAEAAQRERDDLRSLEQLDRVGIPTRHFIPKAAGPLSESPTHSEFEVLFPENS